MNAGQQFSFLAWRLGKDHACACEFHLVRARDACKLTEPTGTRFQENRLPAIPCARAGCARKGKAVAKNPVLTIDYTIPHYTIRGGKRQSCLIRSGKKANWLASGRFLGRSTPSSARLRPRLPRRCPAGHRLVPGAVGGLMASRTVCAGMCVGPRSGRRSAPAGADDLIEIVRSYLK
jgi:hypothetical protein